MKINFKKLICLAIVLIMLINVFMPSLSLALETGKPEVTVVTDKAEVKRGESFTATVKLNTNNVSQIQTLTLRLAYDSSIIEVENTNRLLPSYTSNNEMCLLTDNLDHTQVSMIFTMMTGEINYNGDVYSVTFKVKDDAKIGAINFEVTGDDAIIITDEEGDNHNIEYTSVPAKVDVIAPVDRISLDKTEMELWKNEKQTLTAVLSPEDTTQTKVEWESDRPDIATVSDDGTVTAVSKGEAIITAKAENGLTATCNVTVKQPVEGINLSQTLLELEKDQTETLIATVLPSNADGDKTVQWNTGNPAVATVDNGVVTAQGKGSTQITATVGEFTATCNVTVGVPLKGISFEGNITQKTLNKGEFFDLVVVYDPVDTDVDKVVEWDSTDDTVAKVDNGRVTAVGDGDAKITATVAGKTISCDVRVEIPLNSISIKSETSIKCGQTEKLEVTYDPVDATLDKTIIWTSEDEDIASVSTDGTITAKAVGETKIIASTLGGKTDECIVTVEPVPLEGIEIQEQNITINKGENKDLHVIYYPENTTDAKDVNWTVTPDGIVSIENGKLTALAKGTATVTATVGSQTATTTVIVKVPLEGIILSETDIILNRPETVDLDVTLDPLDATIEDNTVEWTSSDEDVATVDDNGIVTPHNPGTAYIKAKVEDKEATCKITVKVPLEGINIEGETTLLKNQYDELKVTYTPEDATYEGNLIFTSSDESVAKVDENGKVTALKEGTTTITVTAEENGQEFEDKYELTVEEVKMESIAIDTVDFELGINRTKQLNINFYPENTTDDRTTIWSSSDSSIVSVDENGIVKALKEGTAVITATVGDKTANVTVTSVIVPIESIEIQLPGEINIGDSFSLVVKVNPEDATIQDGMIYSSSDTNVIYIDENGRVTAKGVGTAIITVETENGIKEQVEVIVKDPNAVVGEEGTSIAGETESNSSSPKTADIAIEMWIALMVISGLGIATIVIKNKRK